MIVLQTGLNKTASAVRGSKPSNHIYTWVARSCNPHDLKSVSYGMYFYACLPIILKASVTVFSSS